METSRKLTVPGHRWHALTDGSPEGLTVALNVPGGVLVKSTVFGTDELSDPSVALAFIPDVTHMGGPETTEPIEADPDEGIEAHELVLRKTALVPSDTVDQLIADGGEKL